MVEYKGFIMNEPHDRAPWGKIEFDLLQKLIDVALDGVVNPTDHATLNNLQGGISSERYHLLLSEIDKLTSVQFGAQVNVASTWQESLEEGNVATKEAVFDINGKTFDDRMLSFWDSVLGDYLGSIRGDGSILFVNAIINHITSALIETSEATVSTTLTVGDKINVANPASTSGHVNVGAPITTDRVVVLSSNGWADGEYTTTAQILGYNTYTHQTIDRILRVVPTYVGGPAYGWAIVDSTVATPLWQVGDGFYQSPLNLADAFNGTYTGGGSFGGQQAVPTFIAGSTGPVANYEGIVTTSAAEAEIRTAGDIGVVNTKMLDDKRYTEIVNGAAKAELTATGDDRALAVTGAELHVGTPADPRESVFGGGDSYPVQVAYHCDIANTTGLVITSATDVTSTLQSDNSSTVGLFGGTTAGKYLLVGSDYQYQGVKVKLSTLGDITPANLRLESWIGDGVYNPVKYMATNADNVGRIGAQKANNICTDLNEQWRFGFNPFAPSQWFPVTLNINGVNITKYWGRFVIEADIVEDPLVEQMKSHTNRFEINKDGVPERFGLARVSQTLQSGLHITTPNANIDPADENVLYGSLTTAKYVDNEFSNIADDGFLIAQGITAGVDTSIPIAIGLSYYVKGTNTGDIVFDIDVYQVGDGFVYDGTAVPMSYQETDTISVDSNLIRRSLVIQVDAETVSAGEALLISIRRNASSEVLDTLGASVILTYVSVVGWVWR